MTACSESSLGDYYRTIFELKEYREGGVWSIEEIDGMFPFELDLYIMMLKARIEERRQASNTGGKGMVVD